MAIKITGFRPLADALAEFKKPTERAVLRRTAVKMLQPMVARAKDLAPVDEGHLRDSIVIGSQLTRRAKSVERAEPKGGVRVYAGTASRNAVPREFGSERSRAQPFMRPAFEGAGDQMVEIGLKELADDIERTKARVAARALKKG